MTRAEAQRRNRARVLAAARAEFAARGFRDAKVDAIAERAELTRGAVYSNFPGKRALYFAVLADDVERAQAPRHPSLGRTPRDALGALARAWMARLDGGDPRIGAELVPEVLSAELTRRPFAQLLALDAILLGLAVERLEPNGTRLVRMAQSVLTTLHGASQLAAAAPGFAEPFDVVSACERLAGLEPNDWWTAPPVAPPTRPADEPWAPPAATDLVRGESTEAEDGVVAVLGLHRLSAAEQAARAWATTPGRARDGTDTGPMVTVAVVTGEPAELGPLARLVVGQLCGCLRQAFPPEALPRVRVVCDEAGALAAAAGVPAVSDGTEAAVLVEAGRIVARADGLGACHAVAERTHRTTRPSRRR